MNLNRKWKISKFVFYLSLILSAVVGVVMIAIGLTAGKIALGVMGPVVIIGGLVFFGILFMKKFEALVHKDKEIVKSMTDQNALAEIARNHMNDAVCMAAIEKLSDQAVLAGIAKNHARVDVRMAALEKLTDQTVLTDVAKNGQYEDARKKATEKTGKYPAESVSKSAQGEIQPVATRNRVKTDTKFYIFIAQGEGIASAISLAQGAIGFGVKNQDAWRNNLIGSYPGADKMEIVTIESNQWEHPEVGHLQQGSQINFKPYMLAIRKHLIKQFEIQEHQADKAIALVETLNLGVADFWDGKLVFGVPM